MTVVGNRAECYARAEGETAWSRGPFLKIRYANFRTRRDTSRLSDRSEYHAWLGARFGSMFMANRPAAPYRPRPVANSGMPAGNSAAR